MLPAGIFTNICQHLHTFTPQIIQSLQVKVSGGAPTVMDHDPTNYRYITVISPVDYSAIADYGAAACIRYHVWRLSKFVDCRVSWNLDGSTWLFKTVGFKI